MTEMAEKNLIVGYDPAVDIDSIAPHPENYHTGSLADIIQSLTDGQYRPIVVNQRNRFVLAGNNVWRGKKQLGHRTIAVTWVDVDRTEELQILAKDNRIAEKGENDMERLTAILAELGDANALAGTGYTPEEVADLQETLAGADTYPPYDFTGDYAPMEGNDVPIGARTPAQDTDGDGEPDVLTARGALSLVGHLRETIVMVRDADYERYMANIEILKKHYELAGYAVVVIEAVRREAERAEA